MRLGDLGLALHVMLASGLCSACLHDFEIAIDQRIETRTLDGSVPDASGEPAPMEAGPLSAIEAGMEPGADASARLAYRWLANGPEGEVEEGPVTFTLGCLDPAGAPAICDLRCSLNGARAQACEKTFEVKWASAGPQGEGRPHTFCVSAEPRDRDAGTEHGSKVCRHWLSIPYKRAFTWIEQPLDSLTTTIDVPLSCSQRLEGGGQSAPRTDCAFRCSVDGIPYQACSDRFQQANLAPGNHVLRVEVTGPRGTFETKLARVTTKSWVIAAGATPAFVSSKVTLPSLLAREALASQGLAQLLDPYGTFAVACSGDDATEAPKHAERLRRYLSYALGSPLPGFVHVGTDDVVAGCLAALETSPAPCRLLPGMSTTYLEDGPLLVRMPAECETLFGGEAHAGAPCLTHADCISAACERREPFSVESPTLGFCTDSSFPETREGIMCRARGCDDGVFCDGRVCTLLKEPGAPCVRGRQATDCLPEHTCSGSPARCVQANADLGDECSFDRDCRTGRCGAPQVCIAE